MKTFKDYVTGAESLDEAGFVVQVAVRDARKANDLAQDSYRGLYKNDGSDVFIFKKESDKEDFESELLDMELEIIEESVMNEKDLEEFSKVKPIIDKDMKQIRDNLIEDTKTINKVWRTLNSHASEVNPRSLKSIQEIEELLNRSLRLIKILTN